MIIKRLIKVLTIVISVSIGSAHSTIIERPFFHKFENQIDPVIWGYIQFGTFPNGQKAITKVTSTRAQFYQRNVLTNQALELFLAMEIDCKTGVLYVIGLGPLDRIVAMPKEVSKRIQDGHPINLSVYRRICESADIVPGSW